MLNSFGKLLCAVALASAVLAQNVSIAVPVAGTTLGAGWSTLIQVERQASSNTLQEVAIVIGAISCAGGCPDAAESLGQVLYSGSYNPQSTNDAGNQYQEFSVTVPDWTNGPMQLSVAHFYLEGLYATPKLDFATTPIIITGATG